MYEYYERLLKERGLTTAEVCKATGIGQATISAWKKRNSMLGAEYLLLLSKFFNMPIEYFITGSVIDWNANSQEIVDYVVYTEEEQLLIETLRNTEESKRLAIYALLGINL